MISGHKGTGKTTAVRSLVHILPPIEAVRECPYHCPADAPGNMCDACLQKLDDGQPLPTIQRRMPLVELPLSATEDCNSRVCRSAVDPGQGPGAPIGHHND